MLSVIRIEAAFKSVDQVGLIGLMGIISIFILLSALRKES